jgi:hypothetical protein
MAAIVGQSEKDWQAESDLRTLIEAEKIKRDKKRLAAAMKKKREMKKALEQVEG